MLLLERDSNNGSLVKATGLTLVKMLLSGVLLEGSAEEQQVLLLATALKGVWPRALSVEVSKVVKKVVLWVLSRVPQQVQQVVASLVTTAANLEGSCLVE